MAKLQTPNSKTRSGSVGAWLESLANGFDHASDDLVLHVSHLPRGGEAGGVLVAATAVGGRDLAHVDVVLRAHAHTHLSVVADLEEHHRLDFARRERQVDQPLG